MAIPWATNLFHFHLNKLFKKGFVIWHYFVLATFQKLGNFFQIIWSPCSYPTSIYAGAYNIGAIRGKLLVCDA
jgi:hypothetical protein